MVNQTDKQQVRLWVDGIDYGTMSKRAAELYAIEHYRLYPDEPLTIEPVKEEDPMVIPIDRPRNYWNRWTTAKVKRATWLTRPTTCELCNKPIHKGQYYRDGGIHHRVHDACCIAARTV